MARGPYHYEGDTAYTTEASAIIAARRFSKNHDRADYFVIREAGVLRVTDAKGLETFYSGTRDESILFCTGD